jgi:hypothetical protein
MFIDGPDNKLCQKRAAMELAETLVRAFRKK